MPSRSLEHPGTLGRMTATSANVRGDETGMPGLPNRLGPQPAPSFRPCQQYLRHLRLFVLLGLDGNPTIGATVVLRPNSCQSSVCELLNGASPLHQFAAAVLTWGHYRICHQILITHFFVLIIVIHFYSLTIV